MTDPRVQHIEYKCSSCGKETPREKLLVKRVQFAGMGKSGKVRRSRVQAWVGECCLEADPDWTSESFTGSPAMKATSLGAR